MNLKLINEYFWDHCSAEGLEHRLDHRRSAGISKKKYRRIILKKDGEAHHTTATLRQNHFWNYACPLTKLPLKRKNVKKIIWAGLIGDWLFHRQSTAQISHHLERFLMHAHNLKYHGLKN